MNLSFPWFRCGSLKMKINEETIHESIFFFLRIINIKVTWGEGVHVGEDGMLLKFILDFYWIQLLVNFSVSWDFSGDFVKAYLLEAC